jgi:hypothetical protein
MIANNRRHETQKRGEKKEEETMLQVQRNPTGLLLIPRRRRRSSRCHSPPRIRRSSPRRSASIRRERLDRLDYRKVRQRVIGGGGSYEFDIDDGAVGEPVGALLESIKGSERKEVGGKR